MNRFWMIVASSVVLGAVGCGDDESTGPAGSNGPPDFVALESKLTEPSGTFAPGQEASVQDAFGAQTQAAQGNPFGGSSSGSSSSSTQSIRPLDAASSCSGLSGGGGSGTCTCPGGGTLTFDIPANVQGSPGAEANGTIDQTVSIVANACGTGDDRVMDGSIYWKMKNPPPMQLFSVHLKITGKDPAKYDVEYLYKDGVITFAVDVADGRVLVSAKGNWNKETKTGTLVITDKNETWTCSLTNGKGSCTSDKGGTRDVG